MKKVAAIVQLKDKDLSDFQSFLHQHNENISKAYNEVLAKAIEQALGRPFNAEIDTDRLFANTYPNTNQTDYYLDGKLIGTLSTVVGHNGEDFINNKVSFLISFTPCTL